MNAIASTIPTAVNATDTRFAIEFALPRSGSYTKSGTRESPALLYAAIAIRVTVSDTIYGASCLSDANTPTRHNPISDIAVPT